jgi:DNA topoisomerase-1
MDAITLAEALELFKLPKTLGNLPSGDAVKVAIGRFGPYIQYGTKKFVSIKDDDPYTIEMPRALELIKAKEELDANRIILDFADAGIQVLNGRYGPYITDRVKNAKIPKDREPHKLTLEECRELLAAAPERGKGRFGARNAAKKAAVQPAPEKSAAVSEEKKPKAKAKAAPAKKPSAKQKKSAPKKKVAAKVASPGK